MARLTNEQSGKSVAGRNMVADLSSSGTSANGIIKSLRESGLSYSSRQNMLADVRAAKNIPIKPDTSAQSRGGKISGVIRGLKSSDPKVKARADDNRGILPARPTGGHGRRPPDDEGGGVGGTGDDGDTFDILSGVALTDIEQGETGEFVVGGG